MASRLFRSCSLGIPSFGNRTLVFGSAVQLLVTLTLFNPGKLHAQILLQPAEGAHEVTLMPSDLETLESGESRKDLPCTVSEAETRVGL